MIRAKKSAAIFLSAVMLTAYTPGIVHAQDQTTPKKAEAVKTVEKTELQEPASPNSTSVNKESVKATDDVAKPNLKDPKEPAEKDGKKDISKHKAKNDDDQTAVNAFFNTTFEMKFESHSDNKDARDEFNSFILTGKTTGDTAIPDNYVVGAFIQKKVVTGDKINYNDGYLNKTTPGMNLGNSTLPHPIIINTPEANGSATFKFSIRDRIAYKGDNVPANFTAKEFPNHGDGDYMARFILLKKAKKEEGDTHEGDKFNIVSIKYKESSLPCTFCYGHFKMQAEQTVKINEDDIFTEDKILDEVESDLQKKIEALDENESIDKKCEEIIKNYKYPTKISLVEQNGITINDKKITVKLTDELLDGNNKTQTIELDINKGEPDPEPTPEPEPTPDPTPDVKPDVKPDKPDVKPDKPDVKPDEKPVEVIETKDEIKAEVTVQEKEKKSVVKINKKVTDEITKASKNKKPVSITVDNDKNNVNLLLSKKASNDLSKVKKVTIKNDVANVTVNNKELKKLHKKGIRRIVIRKSGKNYKVAFISRNGKSIKKDMKSVIRIKSDKRRTVLIKGKKKKIKFKNGIIKFTLKNAQKFVLR